MPAKKTASPRTAGEMYDWFISRAKWVTPKNTADLVEIGNPKQKIHKIGTGWSPCNANLRAAAKDGCDLFISHEPGFLEYWEGPQRHRQSDWGRARIRLCKELGITTIAFHDTWDWWPKWGVRDSWAEYLGLKEEALLHRIGTTRPWQSVGIFNVKPTTLDAYARHIAKRVAPLGQKGVFVYGKAKSRIRSVAVGTGCAVPTFEALSAGADLLVIIFDRAGQVTTRFPLVELGANIVIVEHGVSEMPGMMNMAKFINKTFPNLPAKFYGHDYGNRVVTA